MFKQLSAPGKLEKIAYDFFALSLTPPSELSLDNTDNNTHLAAHGHHHFTGE